MSSTATVCAVIISRVIMQRWSEIEHEKAQPYAKAERVVRENVVATHHRTLRSNRPIRRAYAK